MKQGADYSEGPLPEEAWGYYNQGKERDRLLKGIGPLERLRIQELIGRFFPLPPATVFDIGVAQVYMHSGSRRWTTRSI
jgi:hypothetical protein